MTDTYSNAQEVQTPNLKVSGSSANDEVYLQSLNIEVDVIGNISTTKFTMVFKNRTSKILEGELNFPLPDGTTVSGFALDINGKMRNAVPVEKAKATQVFEEIVQQRIDPGLLERTEGNNFRTRIYPIPSNGTRTISVSYEQELKIENSALRYRLPMAFKENIEKFSLKATVSLNKEVPQIVENFSDELSFDKQGIEYVAQFSRNDYKPERSLSFALPVPENIPQTIIQSASGSYYFTTSCLPTNETRKKQWNDKIAIIWDVSLSGLERDIKRELNLLNHIIKEKNDLQISLYLLNNQFKDAGNFVISNGNWDELQKTLENLVFDGGTNYSEIDINKISATEILFFSDGISTLSDGDFIKNSRNKSFHCIVSAPKADYSLLKWISFQTGGKFINLNNLSDENLKNELFFESLYFLGVENDNNTRELFPSISTPVTGSFSIAGIMETQKAEITLLFGYGNKVTSKINVDLDAKEATSLSNVYKIWAQKKINELDMQYDKNKEEIKELANQFGIVTRNTSLIVLETIQDYITYNIVPPAELQNEYNSFKKRQAADTEQNSKNMLENAIQSMEDLTKWWNTDFKQQKPKYPQPDTNVPPPSHGHVSEVLNIVEDDVELDDALYVFDTEMDDAREFSMVMASEMPVSDYSRTNMVSLRREDSQDKRNRQSGSTQPSIHIATIKQDNEYMKQLTGNATADYDIYLKIRPEYISTPSFYFDFADWFYKLNDHETAMKILTSIADLDLENASLYRLLSYRFKEYGNFELAVFTAKKVVDWRPMEPQSYRDYALALFDAGKNQEALNELYSVLTRSFSINIHQKSLGIDEVTVTEINNIIAMNKKLNILGIDKKLIFEMPVDIRVVLNWNMNNTDLDLYVKDPNGEMCSYKNKRTALGGRISRDITQGYGPEQFMLKKAIKGKYEIFVNYFGDSQVKAEGPSTVMLEIFTNYSDGYQQRKVVCLQLSKENKKEKNGLVKVAEFEF